MSHGQPHGPRPHDRGRVLADGRGMDRAEEAAHAHEREHQHGAHHVGTSLSRLALSLAVTASVMVVEAVGGWLSGSLALVSDAGHMLTDAGALGLALVAAYLSTRPSDPKRTFGYRRAEVLAAQINVGALLVLSGWICWE